jgi:hypothetical protein
VSQWLQKGNDYKAVILVHEMVITHFTPDTMQVDWRSEGSFDPITHTPLA